MLIKSIKVNGFKSYRNETVVGPFEKGFNVVVGRNGAGKSNFFSAIEFVLSDEYSNLSPQERSSLLSQGTSGQRTLNAYVEIVFDNTSRRLGVNKDEISMRRTIGAKKDQYHLDGKVIPTRKELTGILESAGLFSRFSFFIVKQGQISRLATASDTFRLQIVKDLAGTNVYDEKRDQSMKELESADKVMEDIEKQIEALNARQAELEMEKRDLVLFNKLDAKRRVVEYLILSKDLHELRSKSSQADLEYNALVENSRKGNLKLNETKKQVKEGNETLTLRKASLATITNEISDHRNDLDCHLTEESKLKLRLSDLDKESQTQASEDMEDLKAEMEEKLLKKRKIEESLNVVNAKVEAQKQTLELLEQEKKEIVARSGRNEAFATADERDEWIKNQLKEKEKEREKNELLLVEHRTDLRSKKSDLDELEENLLSKRHEIEELDQELAELNLKKQQLTQDKFQYDSNNDKAFKARREAQSKRRDAENDFLLAESKMRVCKGFKDIRIGAENLQNMFESSPELAEGYHGFVFDHFSCSDQVKVAVDQVLGNRLWHHVVDSKHVATRIMKEFNRRKYSGVLNFIPIQNIQLKTMDMNLQEKEAIPLMEKLDFNQDPDSEKVMSFYFGRTLLCRDLEAAAKIARKTGLDCITLDGERSSGKGVFTGGYLDKSKNNLLCYKSFCKAKADLEELDQELASIAEVLGKLDIERRGVNRSLAESTNKIMLNERKLTESKSCLERFQVERNMLFAQCIDTEKLVTKVQTSLKLLENSCNHLRREMDEELNSQMTQEYQARFEDIVKKLQREKPMFKEASRSLETLETELAELEMEMDLLRRKIHYQADVEAKEADRSNMMTELSNKLILVSDNIKDVTETLARLEAIEDEQTTSLASLRTSVERNERLLDNLNETVADQNKKQGDILVKKNKYQGQIKILNAKVTELGGVDPNMEVKLKNKSRTSLKSLLEKIDKDLERYKHVNKKALEQFKMFETKDRLHEQYKALESSRERIVQLLEGLDEQRASMLDYTFKQVVKNFETTFARIVPGGEGNLAFVYPEVEESSEEEMTQQERFLRATGLKINVSFTGNGVLKSMDQLSGGQKSVVALTFILAMQQCDPAPFYLFDEVDAALDIEHRKAVASIIREQSASAQFIATTFRPELLDEAAKFFGVSFSGTSSFIREIQKDEAEDFLYDD